ncbi:MAG: ferrous iron transport protein A [Clostridia bacterium]|nr:ferrous iron transport protein A [Clostridia bacterium]MBQ1434442.1 ferrous iron transport protein A [Clostridia bacterium]
MNKETFSLDALGVGEWAYVASVGSSGAMRRRLTDIGLVPGTRVVCVCAAPFGDPRAYVIHGAVAAVRACDAREVILSKTI